MKGEERVIQPPPSDRKKRRDLKYKRIVKYLRRGELKNRIGKKKPDMLR